MWLIRRLSVPVLDGRRSAALVVILAASSLRLDFLLKDEASRLVCGPPCAALEVTSVPLTPVNFKAYLWIRYRKPLMTPKVMKRRMSIP